MDTDDNQSDSDSDEVTSLPDLDGSDLSSDVDSDPLGSDDDTDSSEVGSLDSSVPVNEASLHSEIEEDDNSVVSFTEEPGIELAADLFESESDLESNMPVDKGNERKIHNNKRHKDSETKTGFDGKIDIGQTNSFLSQKEIYQNGDDIQTTSFQENHTSLHESDLQDCLDEPEDDFYNIFNLDNTEHQEFNMEDESEMPFTLEEFDSILKSLDIKGHKSQDEKEYQKHCDYPRIGMTLPLTGRKEVTEDTSAEHRQDTFSEHDVSDGNRLATVDIKVEKEVDDVDTPHEAENVTRGKNWKDTVVKEEKSDAEGTNCEKHDETRSMTQKRCRLVYSTKYNVGKSEKSQGSNESVSRTSASSWNLPSETTTSNTLLSFLSDKNRTIKDSHKVTTTAIQPSSSQSNSYIMSTSVPQSSSSPSFLHPASWSTTQSSSSQSDLQPASASVTQSIPLQSKPANMSSFSDTSPSFQSMLKNVVHDLNGTERLKSKKSFISNSLKELQPNFGKFEGLSGISPQKPSSFPSFGRNMNLKSSFGELTKHWSNNKRDTVSQNSGKETSATCSTSSENDKNTENIAGKPSCNWSFVDIPNKEVISRKESNLNRKKSDSLSDKDSFEGANQDKSIVAETCVDRLPTSNGYKPVISNLQKTVQNSAVNKNLFTKNGSGKCKEPEERRYNSPDSVSFDDAVQMFCSTKNSSSQKSTAQLLSSQNNNKEFSKTSEKSSNGTKKSSKKSQNDKTKTDQNLKNFQKFHGDVMKDTSKSSNNNRSKSTKCDKTIKITDKHKTDIVPLNIISKSKAVSKAGNTVSGSGKINYHIDQNADCNDNMNLQSQEKVTDEPNSQVENKDINKKCLLTSIDKTTQSKQDQAVPDPKQNLNAKYISDNVEIDTPTDLLYKSVEKSSNIKTGDNERKTKNEVSGKTLEKKKFTPENCNANIQSSAKSHGAYVSLTASKKETETDTNDSSCISAVRESIKGINITSSSFKHKKLDRNKVPATSMVQNNVLIEYMKNAERKQHKNDSNCTDKIEPSPIKTSTNSCSYNDESNAEKISSVSYAETIVSEESMDVSEISSTEQLTSSICSSEAKELLNDNDDRNDQKPSNIPSFFRTENEDLEKDNGNNKNQEATNDPDVNMSDNNPNSLEKSNSSFETEHSVCESDISVSDCNSISVGNTKSKDAEGKPLIESKEKSNAEKDKLNKSKAKDNEDNEDNKNQEATNDPDVNMSDNNPNSLEKSNSSFETEHSVCESDISVSDCNSISVGNTKSKDAEGKPLIERKEKSNAENDKLNKSNSSTSNRANRKIWKYPYSELTSLGKAKLLLCHLPASWAQYSKVDVYRLESLFKQSALQKVYGLAPTWAKIKDYIKKSTTFTLRSYYQFMVDEKNTVPHDNPAGLWWNFAGYPLPVSVKSIFEDTKKDTRKECTLSSVVENEEKTSSVLRECEDKPNRSNDMYCEMFSINTFPPQKMYRNLFMNLLANKLKQSLYIGPLSGKQLLCPALVEWANKAKKYCINSWHEGKGSALLQFITNMDYTAALESLKTYFGNDVHVEIRNPTSCETRRMKELTVVAKNNEYVESRTLVVTVPNVMIANDIANIFPGCEIVSKIQFHATENKVTKTSTTSTYYIEYENAVNALEATKEHKFDQQKIQARLLKEFKLEYKNEFWSQFIMKDDTTQTSTSNLKYQKNKYLPDKARVDFCWKFQVQLQQIETFMSKYSTQKPPNYNACLSNQRKKARELSDLLDGNSIRRCRLGIKFPETENHMTPFTWKLYNRRIKEKSLLLSDSVIFAEDYEKKCETNGEMLENDSFILTEDNERKSEMKVKTPHSTSWKPSDNWTCNKNKQQKPTITKSGTSTPTNERNDVVLEKNETKEKEVVSIEVGTGQKSGEKNVMVSEKCTEEVNVVSKASDNKERNQICKPSQSDEVNDNDKNSPEEIVTHENRNSENMEMDENSLQKASGENQDKTGTTFAQEKDTPNTSGKFIEQTDKREQTLISCSETEADENRFDSEINNSNTEKETCDGNNDICNTESESKDECDTENTREQQEIIEKKEDVNVEVLTSDLLSEQPRNVTETMEQIKEGISSDPKDLKRNMANIEPALDKVLASSNLNKGHTVTDKHEEPDHTDLDISLNIEVTSSSNEENKVNIDQSKITENTKVATQDQKPKLHHDNEQQGKSEELCNNRQEKSHKHSEDQPLTPKSVQKNKLSKKKHLEEELRKLETYENWVLNSKIVRVYIQVKNFTSSQEAKVYLQKFGKIDHCRMAGGYICVHYSKKMDSKQALLDLWYSKYQPKLIYETSKIQTEERKKSDSDSKNLQLNTKNDTEELKGLQRISRLDPNTIKALKLKREKIKRLNAEKDSLYKSLIEKVEQNSTDGSKMSSDEKAKRKKEIQDRLDKIDRKLEEANKLKELRTLQKPYRKSSCSGVNDELPPNKDCQRMVSCGEKTLNLKVTVTDAGFSDLHNASVESESSAIKEWMKLKRGQANEVQHKGRLKNEAVKVKSSTDNGTKVNTRPSTTIRSKKSHKHKKKRKHKHSRGVIDLTTSPRASTSATAVSKITHKKPSGEEKPKAMKDNISAPSKREISDPSPKPLNRRSSLKRSRSRDRSKSPNRSCSKSPQRTAPSKRKISDSSPKHLNRRTSLKRSRSRDRSKSPNISCSKSPQRTDRKCERPEKEKSMHSRPDMMPNKINEQQRAHYERLQQVDRTYHMYRLRKSPSRERSEDRCHKRYHSPETQSCRSRRDNWSPKRRRYSISPDRRHVSPYRRQSRDSSYGCRRRSPSPYSPYMRNYSRSRERSLSLESISSDSHDSYPAPKRLLPPSVPYMPRPPFRNRSTSSYYGHDDWNFERRPRYKRHQHSPKRKLIKPCALDGFMETVGIKVKCSKDCNSETAALPETQPSGCADTLKMNESVEQKVTDLSNNNNVMDNCAFSSSDKSQLSASGVPVETPASTSSLATELLMSSMTDAQQTQLHTNDATLTNLSSGAPQPSTFVQPTVFQNQHHHQQQNVYIQQHAAYAASTYHQQYPQPTTWPGFSSEVNMAQQYHGHMPMYQQLPNPQLQMQQTTDMPPAVYNPYAVYNSNANP